MIEDIKELLRRMPIQKCPICGCERLWFKELRRIDNNHYNVIFKCDRCAFVNTTIENIVEYDKFLFGIDYTHVGLVSTKGEGVEGFRPIGRKYWFDEDLNIIGSAKCPYCGVDLTITNVNTFIRYKYQYRCDIITRCNKCGKIYSFGVHINEEEFDRLIVR